MSQSVKNILFVLTDILFVCFSMFVAYITKYDAFSFELFSLKYGLFLALLLSCAILSNLFFGCYRGIWKLAGSVEAFRQVAASVLNLCILLLTLNLLNRSFLRKEPFPYTFAILCVLLQLPFMCASRFSYRFYTQLRMWLEAKQKCRNGKRIVVYAGSADGKSIVEMLESPKSNGEHVQLIVDPDTDGKKGEVCGVPILRGGLKMFEAQLKTLRPDEVIIARRGISRDTLLQILRLCSSCHSRLKLYAGIEEYREEIREVNVHDLLGRSPIVLDSQRLRDYVSGKTVLVTGGAGSIGSEICRQALEYGCRRLIAFDIHENGLFELDYELHRRYPIGKFKVMVGSVRDSKRLDGLFATYRPEIVFHAAAHKHVPLMEDNPGEAIKNNVFGTLNVARKAAEYGAEAFILISTDKAVNPVNVMGATKRVAELIVQSLHAENTKFAAVRFGNVLDSNGSVVRIFRRQIEAGGPVTVTHPRMERYFMTISEAVQLVMQAASMAKGGEIFLLDMGRPVKITDLANAMIRLYGLQPGKDIAIRITGMRPGEKFNEDLMLPEEKKQITANGSIFICTSNGPDKDFYEKLNILHASVMEENGDFVALLRELAHS